MAKVFFCLFVFHKQEPSREHGGRRGRVPVSRRLHGALLSYENTKNHRGLRKTMLLRRPWGGFFLNFLPKFSLQVDSLRHLSGDLTRQNNVKKQLENPCFEVAAGAVRK